MFDKRPIAVLCIVLALTAALPQSAADAHGTTLVIESTGAPGCSRAAALTFAALPGQPFTEQNIEGCSILVFTKSAMTDAHVSIIGGDNTRGCDWRPLEAASCSGVWVYTGTGTKVQLVIMSGSVGAVTATAA